MEDAGKLAAGIVEEVGIDCAAAVEHIEVGDVEEVALNCGVKLTKNCPAIVGGCINDMSEYQCYVHVRTGHE